MGARASLRALAKRVLLMLASSVIIFGVERIQSINAERISWCCADFGITPNVLASQLGIAATSIGRALAGENVLTFNQIRKIAEFFGRGVLFFLESEQVDESLVHTPQFRTLANQKPELTAALRTLIKRVERHRDIYLSLIEDLDDEDRPRFSPPAISNLGPSEAARVVRQWLNLGNGNNFETYRAAIETRGVLVVRSNGYKGKWYIPKDNPIHGFTIFEPTCPVPVIFVKKQLSESRQTFTLMHELGHLLIHRASSIDDEYDLRSHQGLERTANAFAGHLLVPNSLLDAIRDEDRPAQVEQFDGWLMKYSREWGVSNEAILRRLLDTGRLARGDYDEYGEWHELQPERQGGGGNRQNRYLEPKRMFGDPFVTAVLDALNARHITLPKASSYLDGLKIKDLHKLEQSYAGF